MAKTKTTKPAKVTLTAGGKKLKAKWAKALRSGNYKQCTGALCRVNGKEEHTYCCLGVLCDVVDSGQWKLKGSSLLGFGRGKSSLYPPKAVLGLVGLTRKDAEKLGSLNDDHGLSFKEIADRLKTNNFAKPEKE